MKFFTYPLLVVFFLAFSNSSSGQKLTIPQLAEAVVQALKTSNVEELVKLSYTEKEYKDLIRKENLNYDDERIAKAVEKEKENIRYRYKHLRYKKELLQAGLIDTEHPKWDSATINTLIYEVEKVKGNSFCAILVELLYNNKKYYLEIESVLTLNGWKIQDDLNMVGSDIEERIKNKNKRM